MHLLSIWTPIYLGYDLWNNQSLGLDYDIFGFVIV